MNSGFQTAPNLVRLVSRLQHPRTYLQDFYNFQNRFGVWFYVHNACVRIVGTILRMMLAFATTDGIATSQRQTKSRNIQAHADEMLFWRDIGITPQKKPGMNVKRSRTSPTVVFIPQFVCQQ